MLSEQAQTLRKAVENLINAKLHDVLTHSNALDRLIAHRTTGVSSPDVREAERRLEEVLAETLQARSPHSNAERSSRRTATHCNGIESGAVVALGDCSSQGAGD